MYHGYLEDQQKSSPTYFYLGIIGICFHIWLQSWPFSLMSQRFLLKSLFLIVYLGHLQYKYVHVLIPLQLHIVGYKYVHVLKIGLKKMQTCR